MLGTPGRSHQRRWIHPNEAAVSCPGGRWGRRRTRVSECWGVLTAENCYTEMLAGDREHVKPGAKGEVTMSLPDRKLSAGWEIRPNAIWRRGRVFLICPRCRLRCTRLYLPT